MKLLNRSSTTSVGCLWSFIWKINGVARFRACSSRRRVTRKWSLVPRKWVSPSILWAGRILCIISFVALAKRMGCHHYPKNIFLDSRRNSVRSSVATSKNWPDTVRPSAWVSHNIKKKSLSLRWKTILPWNNITLHSLRNWSLQKFLRIRSPTLTGMHLLTTLPSTTIIKARNWHPLDS